MQAVVIASPALHLGDRFTDEEGEWEIATRPWTTHGGKTVHASVQKSGIRARSATRPGAHTSVSRSGGDDFGAGSITAARRTRSRIDVAPPPE